MPDMSAAACPNATALAALLESEAAEDMAEYAEHLETCASCQRTLAEMADDSPWAEAGRLLPHVPDRSASNEPALDRVMGQLKKDLPLLWCTTEGGPEEADLPLPCLRPADRPGLLGYLGG